MSGFRFDDGVVQKIMNNADVNGDGVIDYNEFVPMMIGILDATSESQDTKLALNEYSAIHKEAYFQKLFSIADADGSGVLEAFHVFYC